MLRPLGRSIFIEGEGMDHQTLRELDGQWVRLTHCDGLMFEGQCELDDADYCLHEYGRAEVVFHGEVYKIDTKGRCVKNCHGVKFF